MRGPSVPVVSFDAVGIALSTKSVSNPLDRLGRTIDAWLTRRLVGLCAVAILSLAGFILVPGYAVHFPFDPAGNPFAPDLAAHVTAGKIALEGNLRDLYDLPYQYQVQQDVFGIEATDDWWWLDAYISPPFVAYLYAPFAALPYAAMAALWTMLTVALLVVSTRLLWPLVPNLHRYGYGHVLLVMFSAWPVLALLINGQDSAVSLLLFVGGLRLLLARRDLAAGALLGLGVFKPQLFLLVPLLFLLQRRWRALAAWTGVAGFLTIVSLALMGAEGTRSYVDVLTSDHYQERIADGWGWRMHSLAAHARLLLAAAPALVGVITVLGAVAAVGVLARAALRPARTAHEFALLYSLMVLAIPLVAPHFFDYDSTLLLLPILVLLNHDPARRAVRVAAAAGYVLALTVLVGHVAFDQASGPLAALAAPWTIVPLVVLLGVGRQVLLSCRPPTWGRREQPA